MIIKGASFLRQWAIWFIKIHLGSALGLVTIMQISVPIPLSENFHNFFKICHFRLIIPKTWEIGLAWYDSWFATSRPGVQISHLPLSMTCFW